MAVLFMSKVQEMEDTVTESYLKSILSKKKKIFQKLFTKLLQRMA